MQHLLWSVLNQINIKQLINDLRLFNPFANHEKHTHHESNLMPKKSSALNNTLINRKLWTLSILMHELSPEEKDSAHVRRVFIVFILINAFILFAEVSEVV